MEYPFHSGSVFLFLLSKPLVKGDNKKDLDEI